MNDNPDEEYQTLLVNDNFRGAQGIAERIQEINLFDEVILVSPQYEDNNTTGLSLLLETIPQQKKRYMNIHNMLKLKTGYRKLFFAGPNRLVRDAKRLSLVPESKAALIDDGSGSHNGAVLKPFSLFDEVANNNSLKYGPKDIVKLVSKQICRRTVPSRGIYGIEETYLFNPSEKDKSHYKNINIHSISFEDEALIEYIRCIFQIDAESNLPKKIIYLSLPDYCSRQYKDAEYLVLEMLAKSNYDITFRPHPRRLDFSYVPREIAIDEGRDFWEISWLFGQYDENTVLVGAGSSALLTPKILLNLEPIVVFTHRLNGIIRKNNFDYFYNIEESFFDLQERYVHKERVCAPTTFDELMSCINR